MVQVVSTIAQPEDKATVWHSLKVEEVIALVQTESEQGLSSAVVKQRLASFGTNEFTVKGGKPWWLKFLLQFNQPLLIILLCAGLVKALSGSLVNAGVIWGVTTTNAIIGFVQESKAEGAIAALAKATGARLADARPVIQECSHGRSRAAAARAPSAGMRRHSAVSPS